jgi:hypothetical protein
MIVRYWLVTVTAVLSLAACKRESQFPMSAVHSGAPMSCRTSQSSMGPMCVVSIIALASDPIAFSGKRVQVTGVVKGRNGALLLCVRDESFRYGISSECFGLGQPSPRLTKQEMALGEQLAAATREDNSQVTFLTVVGKFFDAASPLPVYPGTSGTISELEAISIAPTWSEE